MIVEMLFRQGDILDRPGSFATLEFHESIDPEPAHGCARE
jgi:hypothetical protein